MEETKVNSFLETERIGRLMRKGVTIFLQSLGRAGTSTLLSMFREIVCGVGLVLLLPIWFGLDGLLWFMAIADIITFAASLAVLIHIDKSLQISTRACKNHKFLPFINVKSSLYIPRFSKRNFSTVIFDEP